MHLADAELSGDLFGCCRVVSSDQHSPTTKGVQSHHRGLSILSYDVFEYQQPRNLAAGRDPNDCAARSCKLLRSQLDIARQVESAFNQQLQATKQQFVTLDAGANAHSAQRLE